MRRKLLKALSLVLGATIAGAAQAQDVSDDVACEYGVVPFEPIPEPEPVPLYGIEEPTFFPPPSPGPSVRGVVQQAGTGLPLEGVRVSLGDQVVTTGPDGRFDFAVPLVPGETTKLVFRAEDLDGEEHGGEHKPARITVKAVDGALPWMIAEQGLLLEMKKR
jgi:hypothetical protein